MHRFDKRELSAGDPAFRHPLTVRFQDVDAAGIGFFARITTYFHDAYFAFLASRGCDVPEIIAEAPYMAPMVHCEADFLRPLRFGDEVEAQVVAARLEGSELVVGFRLVRRDDGTVAAVGQQGHVFVDRTDFTRVPAPEEFRAAFEGFQSSTSDSMSG